jgi:hypothetical protein
MPVNETTTNLGEAIQNSAVALLKQAFLESLGYDMRDGSAIATMLVNRQGDYHQPVLDFMNNILGSLNTNMSSDYLTFYDILANVYLTERNTGSKASGDVKFGFEEQNLVEIPQGGIVSTGEGLQFQVTRKYTFAANQLILVNGMYYTPGITVEAMEEGTNYEIGAREIINTLMTLDGLVDLYNESSFTGGSAVEDNDTLIARLRDSVSARTLSNYPGIRYILQEAYSSLIHDMEIVGAGDAEMERDVVYSQTLNSGIVYDRIDYARKIEGSLSEERSLAFRGLAFETLEPEVTVDGSNFATVAEITTELTQEQYITINGEDANLLISGADEILTEDWTRGGDTSQSTPWMVSETNAAEWRTYAEYIVLGSGKLIMGAAAISQNLTTLHEILQESVRKIQTFHSETLNLEGNAELKELLDTAVKRAGPQNTQSTADGTTTVPIYSEFLPYLNGLVEKQLLNDPDFKISATKTNISPVVQIALDQNEGCIVRGTFKIVDDDGTEARPFYITNFRSNGDNPRAQDGYGLAVLLSPTNQEDIDANKPSLFLTDNNALADDLIIAGPTMHDDVIYENYLTGTNTVSIVIDTEYTYELIYSRPASGSQAVALEARVWPSSGGRPSPATLSYGAYVPMNVRSTNIKGEGQSLDATDFGFGVLQTGGFTWEVGPVDIVQSVSMYSMVLYKLDTSAFTGESVELMIGHRGYGSDAGTQTNKSMIKIVDFDTPASPVWEDVFTNTTDIVAVERKVFDVDRYSDANDYMFVLLTAGYPFDGANQINSIVETDYISISKNFTGYNVGSKVDVYIHKVSASFAPESEDYIDFMSVSGRIALNATNSFKMPITRIENVEILTGGGAPTGTYLTEYNDFRMVSNAPEEDGSVRENKILLLSNFAQVYNLRVRYKYVSDFDTMQAYVDSDSARGVRSDILLKHPQIKYIDVTFTAGYSGTDLIDAIKEYIYEAKTAVRSFDIIALAVEYGVASGSVSSMSLDAEYYDSDGNLKTETDPDEITKTRIQVFVPNTITIS